MVLTMSNKNIFGGIDRMESREYNRGNSSFGEEAERERPIPHESAVDVQVASAQTVSEPTQATRKQLSPQNRHALRNARRRWRFLDGNGEFCARETGEKFLRPVGEYDPKSRERWGKGALAPEPMDEKVVVRERANLRSDLASNTEKRRETINRVWFWLAEYMQATKASSGDETKDRSFVETKSGGE